MTFGIAMSTDACAIKPAVRRNGSTTRSCSLSRSSAFAFLIDVAVSVMLLVKQRLAFFVPLIGCIAQIALILAALMMTSKAGPI